MARRERRVLAVGLLAGLILGMLLLVVQPLVGLYRSYSEAIDDGRFQLERYRQVAATVPALRAEVEFLREHIGNSGLFLGRETPDLAAVELQQYLEGIARGEGANVRSLQVMNPVGMESVTRVRIRVDVQGDSETMAGVFTSLEEGRPVTLVDSVTVSPQQARRRSRGEPPEVLQIRFELSGFMAEARE